MVLKYNRFFQHLQIQDVFSNINTCSFYIQFKYIYVYKMLFFDFSNFVAFKTNFLINVCYIIDLVQNMTNVT